MRIVYKKEKQPPKTSVGIESCFFLLPCKDSNPDKQCQKLMCYHYTTRQYLFKRQR